MLKNICYILFRSLFVVIQEFEKLRCFILYLMSFINILPLYLNLASSLSLIKTTRENNAINKEMQEDFTSIDKDEPSKGFTAFMRK